MTKEHKTRTPPQILGGRPVIQGQH